MVLAFNSQTVFAIPVGRANTYKGNITEKLLTCQLENRRIERLKLD
jgi:hypothetical protein